VQSEKKRQGKARAIRKSIQMTVQPIRLALIVSNYYPGYSKMVEAARAEAASNRAEVVFVCEVPGCFDMPLPIKALLQRDDVDAVVALGVILPVPHKTMAGGSPRDEITIWDETIANGTISRLDELALAFNKPVVKELIGPGFAVGMVKGHIEQYARAGVQSALVLVNELRRIRTSLSSQPGKDASQNIPEMPQSPDKRLAE
jgi:6,7-dimethyl-8-ribityllumazine synthase